MHAETQVEMKQLTCRMTVVSEWAMFVDTGCAHGLTELAAAAMLFLTHSAIVDIAEAYLAAVFAVRG